MKKKPKRQRSPPYFIGWVRVWGWAGDQLGISKTIGDGSPLHRSAPTVPSQKPETGRRFSEGGFHLPKTGTFLEETGSWLRAPSRNPRMWRFDRTLTHKRASHALLCLPLHPSDPLACCRLFLNGYLLPLDIFMLPQSILTFTIGGKA